MAVNENIYGAKNLWHDAFFQQSQIINKNKLPYFDVNCTTLLDGTRAGKLSFNEPIDKSISYCGLGTESALSHIAYTNFVNGNVEITDIQDRNITNFGFFEKNNTVQFISNSSAFYYDNINWIKWGDDYAESTNYQRLLSALTLVNPRNIVLAINVSAYDNNMSDHITTSLYNYIQYNTSSHPNIDRVTIQPYYGDISLMSQRDIYGGQGNVTYRIPFQLGILDEYKISSKNVNFYSYGIADFPVFGNVQNLPYTYNSTNVFGMVLHTENSLSHIKIVPNSNDTTYIYTEYYPEFEQDIMKTVACFGLYFSPIVSIARTGSLTDNDMYIGLLDENGIGHGEYLRGTNTVNAPQNNYNDMSDSGYDYKKHGDNTKYQNDTEFYDSTIANGFTRFWVLDSNGVSQVLNEMYDIMNEVDPDEPIERYSQKVFLTNNPIDCIISLKKFPVLHIPSLTGAYFVNFGSKATSISAYPLAKSCETYTFNFSAANDTSLYPVFGGDYRDYEPYTKCEVIIPFCGSVDVPCCYFYEYGGITVKLTIDFISGACTGFVLANGITINSVSGNCAMDMPVSGIQSATLDSQIFSAAQAKKQNFTKTRAGLVASALTATAGAITGNPIMIAAGAAGVLATAVSSKEAVKTIDYELQHLQTPYKEVSTASGQIAQSFDMRCKLIITRSKMLNYDENAYAETVGYACLDSGSVDSFHGLTYGTIVLNGVPCTADEKSYIESMFANGVHLPTTYP